MDPHRAQISKEFFDQAEGRGIFVDVGLAEAHRHMEQVENHTGNLRMVGNRTMEDLDIDEADFQQLLDELTDAKNNLAQHNGYLPRPWVLGSSLRVLGHVLEYTSDLPLPESEGRWRKQAQCRHKMSDGSDGGGSEHEDQKELSWKIQTNER